MEPFLDPQLDDPLVQFQHDPAWRMVYVGLTVVQVGMAIFFVAGLVAWFIFLVLALDSRFRGLCFQSRLFSAVPLLCHGAAFSKELSFSFRKKLRPINAPTSEWE